MTEMLIRLDETPLHDAVLEEVQAAAAQAAPAPHTQGARRPAEETQQPASDMPTSADARTWGIAFVRQTVANTSEQPVSQPEQIEFDTSTLAGARAAAQAALRKYGVADTKAIYPWNTRAERDARRQSVFGRMGIRFS